MHASLSVCIRTKVLLPVNMLLPVNSGERLRHVAVEHRSCRERESGRTQLHHSSVAQRVSGRQRQWDRWSAQLGGLHLMADVCLELSAFYIRAPSSPLARWRGEPFPWQLH